MTKSILTYNYKTHHMKTINVVKTIVKYAFQYNILIIKLQSTR